MYKTIFSFLIATFLIFNLNTTTYAANDATSRLETAIINDDYPMAQQAFKDGANLHDARFNYANNPLDLAIARNSITMVSLLIQKGADVNARIAGTDGYLSTPLIKAIEEQNLPVVTMLLNAKALVNNPTIRIVDTSPLPTARKNSNESIKAETGVSPLMAAVLAQPKSNYTSSKYAIFELLLSKGADVKYTTSEGFSILMATTLGENSVYQQEIALIMAKALIKKGADPELRDNTGKTALDYAQMKKFTKMINFLTSIREK